MTTNAQRCRWLLLLAALALCDLLLERAHAATPPATWTTGHKKVLVIPVRFTDFGGPSDVPNSFGYYSGWGNFTNGTRLAEITNFFASQSYGKCTVAFTILPEINLGVSYTVYTNPLSADSLQTKFARWSDPGSLADDVRAKARQVGIANGNAALYDTDNYDLDIVATGFLPTQNTGSAGLTYGKGVLAPNFKVLAHELCHNLGLQHANGVSRAALYAPQKSGSFFTDTYADVFDLQGYADTWAVPLLPDRDANVYWKHLLGWLPDENIFTPTNSGTNRLYAFDQGTVEPGKNYALRVVRDPTHTYWFSFRQGITNTAEGHWSTNGLEVRFGAESVLASAGNTILLDMTPGSRGLPGPSNSPYATMYDAPLLVGRTFTDAEANLHVTPIRKAGTTPESLDVVINFGPFPGNSAPGVSIAPLNTTLAAGVTQTFTATASDPDGDTLAYYWEFDDPDALGGNDAGNTHPDARLSTQGSHAWTRQGDFLVRCTVTDMKGHATVASTRVTVTSGTPAILTISGVIRDENGNPLAGAVVNNYKPGAFNYGSTNFACSSETAADGRYVVQLSRFGTFTNTFAVLYRGYDFTCSVANAAITVPNASVTNVNFTLRRTNHWLTGQVLVAGRAYNPTNDGAFTVHVGGQNVPVGFGSWSALVADGSLVNITATPANPAYTYDYNFSTPHLAVNECSNRFYFAVNIPGQMPLTGFVTSGTNSDDNVGTVQIPVKLTPPVGSNSWPGDQVFEYWIDASSTAEYGVDYKMSGGRFTFYGGVAPVPRLIPLKIFHNGVPKNKTVVIRIGTSSSVASLGTNLTFTYTINNPPPPVTASGPNNGVFNLTWPGVVAARYTVESTRSLTPPAWSNRPPHTNLAGTNGLMTRSVMLDGATNEFFRLKIE